MTTPPRSRALIFDRALTYESFCQWACEQLHAAEFDYEVSRVCVCVCVCVCVFDYEV